MVAQLLIIFVLGGILGTAGDYSHVASLTDGYANPWYPLPTGQPLWVPFLFATATLSITLSQLLSEPILGTKNKKIPSLGSAFAGASVFLGLYVASGFLPLPTGGAKDLLLWTCCFLFWALADRTWQGVVFAVGTAIVGTLVEIGLTRSGAFYYTEGSNNFFGVPSWLPALYVAASVAIGNLTQVLIPVSKKIHNQR